MYGAGSFFDDFYAALSAGAYNKDLAENNRLAWAVYRFAAVPSLCMNGQELRSMEDIGLSRQAIAAFLDKNTGL